MRLANKTVLSEKISESLASVLPVTGIVLFLILTFFVVLSSTLSVACGGRCRKIWRMLRSPTSARDLPNTF